ncbi:MAG: calcium/sodium antiporter [Bacteroidales bacterium]|nr:calcium/sodium antiporter [Candidatus Cacconaster equifaecalis]
MFLTLILLAVGLAMIVFGADFLVEGASAIARRSGISEFVIGLTIVGFGTSCPELVVSITGALAGNSDVAIGNVIGSNSFNSLFILGLTAVISPVAITAKNKKRDIPIVIAVSMFLAFAGMFLGKENGISRVEGAIFLLVFAAYMYYCFKQPAEDSSEDAGVTMKISKAVIYVIAGLGGLIYGGQIFVSSATDIAHWMGVSDKVIAITLLAGGTSLPELATCIAAVVRKRGQLALGNILGSNIFNILLILGCAAVISPLSFKNINYIDMGALIVSQILIFTSAFAGKKNTIDRLDGAIMLLCEGVYLTLLFLA